MTTKVAFLFPGQGNQVVGMGQEALSLQTFSWSSPLTPSYTAGHSVEAPRQALPAYPQGVARAGQGRVVVANYNTPGQIALCGVQHGFALARESCEHVT